MHILLILFKLLLNPAVLILAGVVVAGLVALWFIGGPVRFAKVIGDFRVWLAVAGVALFLAFANVSHKLDVVQAQQHQQQLQSQAVTDAGTVVTHKVQKQAARQSQDNRLQEAITNAQPGQAQDAVLDAIDHERGGGPAPGGKSVGVRHDQVGVIHP